MGWRHMRLLAAGLTAPMLDEETGVVGVIDASGRPK